eukprot:TRINITY_DN22835_c0_g2_i1.p1 TRINITY_DN22835_c0_g2~~TRINITY_DN22835_c0_g2_i1.p1  ORF type:complete len:1682 (+),score=79.53 TRINITY_DN22835_c0_g2_i1:98-5047(+)
MTTCCKYFIVALFCFSQLSYVTSKRCQQTTKTSIMCWDEVDQQVNIQSIDQEKQKSRWIVKINKEGDVETLCGKLGSYQIKCIKTYQNTFKGAIIESTAESIKKLLREINVIEVASIDSKVAMLSTVEQSNPEWYLDRIDQRQLPLDKVYSYKYNGTGVNVYIIDTGIQQSHKEFASDFGSRSEEVLTLSTDGQKNADCEGHGTHVAGVIGGKGFGVAKNVKLNAIRALQCDGQSTISAVLDSMEWIIQSAKRPALLVMALGSLPDPILDEAVYSVVRSGISVIVAAGNEDGDACSKSPARVQTAVTVGAATPIDERLWLSEGVGSNYGSCVDIFAPGTNIKSASIGELDATERRSGTSQAVPVVAGVMALFLQNYPDASPQEVKLALQGSATRNVLSENPLSGQEWHAHTPNLLLNSMVEQLLHFEPGQLRIEAGFKETYEIKLKLKQRPKYQVAITTSSSRPSLASVSPKRIIINPRMWAREVTVQMDLSLQNVMLDVNGDDFLLYFQLISDDEDFNGRQQAVSVVDMKGDTHKYPKVISSAPFEDYGSTYKFGDDYDHSCSDYEDNGSSSDVVYYFKPESTCTAEISLCNSDFDTKVYVLSDVDQWNGTFAGCNDDACSYQSRILVELQKGVSYGIVIDGYNGKIGEYHLQLSCYEGETSGMQPPIQWYQVLGTTFYSDVEIPTQAQQELYVPVSIGIVSQRERYIEPTSTQEDGGEYRFNMSEWTDCSQPCGGGVRFKLLPCVDEQGNIVSPDFCPQINQVNQKQVESCNLNACEEWSSYTLNWSDCSQSCGIGFQQRNVLCQSTYGRLAPRSYCGNMTTEIELYRECEQKNCKEKVEYGPWSSCSANCGGGVQSRSVICISDDQSCSSVEDQKICNSRDCSMYIWNVSKWTKCSKDCGGGIQTRTVSCRSVTTHTNVDSSMCNTSERPLTTKKCNSQPCEFCNNNSCSGHGNCTNQQCICDEDWKGVQCEVPKVCIGGLDKYQNCCKNIINKEGGCCPASSELDHKGDCCIGGKVDMCGICNGTATTFDMVGRCTEGSLDVMGFACDSGIIDECGVCDGDHSSCATNVTIALQWKNVEFASVDPTFLNNWVDLKKNLAIELASILGIDSRLVDPFYIELEVQAMPTNVIQNADERNQDEAIEIKSVNLSALGTLAPIAEMVVHSNRGLLQTPTFNVRFRVSPRAESYKTEISKVLTIGEVEYILRQEQTDQNSSLIIADVVVAEKVGICGNGICEIGEQPLEYPDAYFNATTQEPGTCPEDCISKKVCPAATQSGLPCGQHGICLASSGVCECFVGYSGSDCSECDDEYYQDGTECRLITSSIFGPPSLETEVDAADLETVSSNSQSLQNLTRDVGPVNLTQSSIVSTGSRSILPWVLSILMVCLLGIIVGIIVYTAVRRRRNREQVRVDTESISDLTLSSNHSQPNGLDLPQMQIYSERTPNTFLSSIERALQLRSRNSQQSGDRSPINTNTSSIYQEKELVRQSSSHEGLGSQKDTTVSYLSTYEQHLQSIADEILSIDSEEVKHKPGSNDDQVEDQFDSKFISSNLYVAGLAEKNRQANIKSFLPQRTGQVSREVQNAANRLHLKQQRSDDLPTKLQNQQPPLRTREIPSLSSNSTQDDKIQQQQQQQKQQYGEIKKGRRS